MTDKIAAKMTDEPALIFRDKYENDAIRVEFLDYDGACEPAQNARFKEPFLDHCGSNIADQL